VPQCTGRGAAPFAPNGGEGVVGPPAQGRSPLGRSPRWRVLLVVGGGRLGARVRRAVAGTPAVTVVGEVPGDAPGLAGVAVAATELAPVVVVTATGSALPASPSVRGRLRALGVAVVAVVTDPTRDGVRGLLRNGLRGIVSDAELTDSDLIGLSVAAAARDQVFVTPAAATVAAPGSVSSQGSGVVD